MNADEIRAEVVAVAAKEIASWESDPSPNSRHFNCGGGIADALAEAGLLPTGVEISSVFPDAPEADDEMMRRYVTGWAGVSK